LREIAISRVKACSISCIQNISFGPPHAFFILQEDGRQAASPGKVKTVFALLICVAQFFFPSFATLFAEIQLHAMILSFSVFAFILCRLVPGSRTGAT